MRDHIVLHKTTTDVRIAPGKHRSGRDVKTSAFARFSASIDFRLLQQYRHLADIRFWSMSALRRVEV